MAASERTPLQRAVDQFLLDGRARRLSRRTLEGFYQWQLERLVKWLLDEGVSTAADVTRSHIRAYLVSLEAAGWRDRSAHAAGRSARAFFRFLVEEGLLDKSPMEGIKLPKVAHDPLPALSTGDIDRLLAAAYTERDRAIVLALLDTGCRAAEFVALNVGDVDVTGLVMVLRGKGKKSRRVRLGDRSLAAVQRYLDERAGLRCEGAFGSESGAQLRADAPMWVSETTGLRLTYVGLQQVLVRLGKRAGVDHSHAHSFRRSCALFMSREGATELEIALYLGHSDTTVTRTYLALDETDMVRVHARCGAVASLESARRVVAVPERPKLRLVGR